MTLLLALVVVSMNLIIQNTTDMAAHLKFTAALLRLTDKVGASVAAVHSTWLEIIRDMAR